MKIFFLFFCFFYSCKFLTKKKLIKRINEVYFEKKKQKINSESEEEKDEIQEGQSKKELQQEKVEEEKVEEEKVEEEKVQEEKVQEEKVQEEKVQEEKVQEEKVQEEKVQEEKNFLKNNIEYQANFMTFDIEKSIVELVEETRVVYGKNKIDAYKIIIDWKKNILEAFAKRNSNRPVELKDKFTILFDEQEYSMDRLKINFESERGIFNNFFYKKEDLFIRAEKLKKDYDDIFFASKISCTTCDLEKPHYSIFAKKVKIIDQNKLLAEKMGIEFYGIEILNSFLGLFYTPDKNRGIIPPSYGGSSEKGFHIKKVGYYWNFDDFIDLAISTDIYTKGNISFEVESFYKKRYLYDGSFNFNFSKYFTSLKSENVWNFNWKHKTQDLRNYNLAADLNIVTKKYDEYSDKYGEIKNSNNESNIVYTNKLNFLKFYNFGAALSLSDNNILNESNLVLPHLLFFSDQIFLFSRKNNWYSNFNIQHKIEFKNTVNFDKNFFDITDLDDLSFIFSKKKYGIKNTFVLKNEFYFDYLNIIPYLEYRERWYFDFIDHSDAKKIKKQFNRVWDYETGIEFCTNLYGQFSFKSSKISSIKHHFIPTLKLIFNDEYLSYWEKIDDNFLNKFDKYPFETPFYKKNLILELTLDNIINFILNKKNNENTKIAVFDKFEIKTAYNFFEKDFPLLDLEIKTITKIFSDYLFIETKQKYDQYLFERDDNNNFLKTKKLALFNKVFEIGHLNEGRISLIYKIENKEPSDQLSMMIKNLKRQQEYLDSESNEKYKKFSFFYDLELRYDYVYKSSNPKEFSKLKIISFDFSLYLFDFWVLKIESGYDFFKNKILKEFTKIGAKRDLHCWEMNFEFYPISKNQRFTFSFGVKAKVLNSLKYERKNSKYINV
jgi:hypothetical protein